MKASHTYQQDMKWMKTSSRLETDEIVLSKYPEAEDVPSSNPWLDSSILHT